jgi:hypothetical protein
MNKISLKELWQQIIGYNAILFLLCLTIFLPMVLICDFLSKTIIFLPLISDRESIIKFQFIIWLFFLTMGPIMFLLLCSEKKNVKKIVNDFDNFIKIIMKKFGVEIPKK